MSRAGRLAGRLAGRGGGSLAGGASVAAIAGSYLVAHYRAGNYTPGSGLDVAGAPNLEGTAAYDVAQATESQRPHIITDSGHSAFEGDSGDARLLAVDNVSPNVFSAGDFGSLWCVSRSALTGTQWMITCGNGGSANIFGLYRTNSSIRADVDADVGAILKSTANTSTDILLVRGTLLSSGLTLKINDAESTTATANAGIAVNHDEINLMAGGTGGQTWNSNCFEWVVTKNEPATVRAELDAFLGNGYGVPV